MYTCAYMMIVCSCVLTGLDKKCFKVFRPKFFCCKLKLIEVKDKNRVKTIEMRSFAWWSMIAKRCIVKHWASSLLLQIITGLSEVSELKRCHPLHLLAVDTVQRTAQVRSEACLYIIICLSWAHVWNERLQSPYILFLQWVWHLSVGRQCRWSTQLSTKISFQNYNFVWIFFIELLLMKNCNTWKTCLI